MSEVDKAAAAAKDADSGAPTVFDKILSGEWSSDKVYEDDLVYAFRDISPQAPVHVLVIPNPYLWRKPQVVRWYGRRG